MPRTSSLTALRAQLRAADPHRPGVSRMGRDEVEFLIGRLAVGDAPVRAEDDVDPIGAVRFDDLPWDGVSRQHDAHVKTALNVVDFESGPHGWRVLPQHDAHAADFRLCCGIRAEFDALIADLPPAAPPALMPAEVPPVLGLSPFEIRKRFFGAHAG